MKLEKHYSLVEAERVLKSLQKLFDTDLRLAVLEDAKFTIEAYQNGREQGYTINYFIRPMFFKVFFIAQQRNSDDIVVYYGNPSNQSVSEDTYKNSKYFSYQDYDGAAQYIVDTIIQEYKKYQKVRVL